MDNQLLVALQAALESLDTRVSALEARQVVLTTATALAKFLNEQITSVGILSAEPSVLYLEKAKLVKSWGLCVNTNPAQDGKFEWYYFSNHMALERYIQQNFAGRTDWVTVTE
jgi:hypothetical protein